MNKKSIVQLLSLLALVALLFSGLMGVQDASAPEASQNSGAVTPPDETQGNSAVVTDSTPNYDPNDPYGVKFGATVMGGLLLLIIVQWLFGEAARAMSKGRGGGS